MDRLTGKRVAKNLGQSSVVSKKWKIANIILNVRNFLCVFWVSETSQEVKEE